jgi:hypothetical protein
MKHVATLIKVYRTVQTLKPTTAPNIRSHSTAVSSSSEHWHILIFVWLFSAIKSTQNQHRLTHMPEHDTRGAKVGPRGRLGHALMGRVARGPNADVMFVYVWSPYISLGLVIPGPPLPSPASAFTTVDLAFHLDRHTNPRHYKSASRRQPCLYPTTLASLKYV